MPRTSAKSRDLDRGIGGQYAYETETQGKLHSMVDKESPLVHRHLRHLPGDTVQIEIGFFRHGMNLKEVLATFEHAIDKPFEITLRGHPEPVRTDFVSKRLGKHLGRFASSLLRRQTWPFRSRFLDNSSHPTRCQHQPRKNQVQQGDPLSHRARRRAARYLPMRAVGGPDLWRKKATIPSVYRREVEEEALPGALRRGGHAALLLGASLRLAPGES